MLLEMSKSGEIDYYNKEVGISNEFESSRYLSAKIRGLQGRKVPQDASKVNQSTTKNRALNNFSKNRGR